MQGWPAAGSACARLAASPPRSLHFSLAPPCCCPLPVTGMDAPMHKRSHRSSLTAQEGVAHLPLPRSPSRPPRPRSPPRPPKPREKPPRGASAMIASEKRARTARDGDFSPRTAGSGAAAAVPFWAEKVLPSSFEDRRPSSSHPLFFISSECPFPYTERRSLSAVRHFSARKPSDRCPTRPRSHADPSRCRREQATTHHRRRLRSCALDLRVVSGAAAADKKKHHAACPCG
jgi:hypothetical protein